MPSSKNLATQDSNYQEEFKKLIDCRREDKNSCYNLPAKAEEVVKKNCRVVTSARIVVEGKIESE